MHSLTGLISVLNHKEHRDNAETPILAVDGACSLVGRHNSMLENKFLQRTPSPRPEYLFTIKSIEFTFIVLIGVSIDCQRESQRFVDHT